MIENKRPQRPRTAFMYYANENRESLQHQYPSVHYSEVGKILGDKWLELPSPQKEVRLIIPSSSRDISCKKQTTVLMIVMLFALRHVCSVLSNAYLFSLEV